MQKSLRLNMKLFLHPLPTDSSAGENDVLKEQLLREHAKAFGYQTTCRFFACS